MTQTSRRVGFISPVRLLKIGLAVLAASLCGAAMNLWARGAFPDQWGGPNIGGGMLQLLFYVGVAAGGVTIVTSIVRRRAGASGSEY